MNKNYRGAYERRIDRVLESGQAVIDINWINISAKEADSGGADRITKKLLDAGYRPDGISCAPAVRKEYETGQKLVGKYIRLPQETWLLKSETPAGGSRGVKVTTNYLTPSL